MGKQEHLIRHLGRQGILIDRRWMRKNRVALVDDYGIIWEDDSAGHPYWAYKWRLVGRRTFWHWLTQKPKRVVLGKVDQLLLMEAKDPDTFLLSQVTESARRLYA